MEHPGHPRLTTMRKQTKIACEGLEDAHIGLSRAMANAPEGTWLDEAKGVHMEVMEMREKVQKLYQTLTP